MGLISAEKYQTILVFHIKVINWCLRELQLRGWEAPRGLSLLFQSCCLQQPCEVLGLWGAALWDQTRLTWPIWAVKSPPGLIRGLITRLGWFDWEDACAGLAQSQRNQLVLLAGERAFCMCLSYVCRESDNPASSCRLPGGKRAGDGGEKTLVTLSMHGACKEVLWVVTRMVPSKLGDLTLPSLYQESNFWLLRSASRGDHCLLVDTPLQLLNYSRNS